MRTDVDVLFIGGPLDRVTYAIEKQERGGTPRPPASIPVGSFNLGPLVFPTIDPSADSDLVAIGMPMVGSGPITGKYVPEGVSDNGRLAYVWHDHA